MGTTLTANLSLVKPDRQELIPNWAVQNETTYEILDNILTNASDSYTPSWTASTSNPTLGSGGFLSGRYVTIWPNIVWFWIRVNAGTTGFNAGSGKYSLSLPFFADALLPASTNTGEGAVLGRAELHDNSSTSGMQNAVVQLHTTSTILLCVEAGSTSSQWFNNNPFTVSQGDRVSLYGMYFR